MKRRAKQTLDSLLDVRDALALVIHDAWVGYNEHSPIAAAYDLARAPNGSFSGKGRLSTSLAGERVLDVHLSQRAARSFLDRLAGVPVVEEGYAPQIDHTDDYPRIEIAIHVGVRDMARTGGNLVLFTESQGEFHTPWGVFVGGKIMRCDDDGIGRALRAIEPPLQRSVLKRMAEGTEPPDPLR